MKYIYRELELNRYRLKFIIDNELKFDNNKKTKKIAIFIDENSTSNKNEIIENNIKVNNEIRIFNVSKKEILDIL